MSTVFESDRQFRSVIAPQKVTTFTKHPDNTMVAVGGREVFNLVDLNPFKTRMTLRNRSVMKGQGIIYAIACTKWNPKEKSTIASISPSGAVVLWRLGDKPSTDYCEYHSRSGNSLSWSHFDPNTLFSAAQDAVVGVWDTRDFKTKPKICIQFTANNVCREVACCPLNQDRVAVTTEGGCLHVYDVRRPSAPVREIFAHASHFTVDWHPQVMDALCTGSSDHWLHVWDLSKGGSTPLHKIQTIASVSKVQWRPSSVLNSTSTSFATTSMFSDQDIRIWDLNVPFAPVSCFRKVHAEAIADVVWLDADNMLSLSQDGILKIQHISLATPTQDKPNTCVAWLPPRSVVSVHSAIVREAPKEIIQLPPPVVTLPPPPPKVEARGLFDKIFPGAKKTTTATTANPAMGGDSPSIDLSSKEAFTTLPPVSAQRVRSLVEVNRLDPPSSSLSPSATNFKKFAQNYALPTQMKFFSADTILKNNIEVAISAQDNSIAAMWTSLSVALSLKEVDPTLCSDLVMSYLDTYSDIGDVQHCSHIYVTMCASGGVTIDQGHMGRVFEWIMAYVEQLDILRLTTISIAIVRSAQVGSVHDAMRVGLMGASTFSIVCSCGGKESGTLHRCGQCCTPMHWCAICENSCTGLYIWFRVCGHGGCAQHVSQWIQYCNENGLGIVCPKCATQLV